MKSKLAVDFADLVYNGKWFTPLREALTAFATETQKHVTGQVKLKLYKGNIITSGVTSPETLYSEDIVTFQESDYNQNDIIPTEIIDRTLDDVKKASPILKLVNMAPANVKKWIVASHSGAAVWGPLTDAIKGELSAEVTALNIDLHKLTAYIVIPKSIRELSMEFVDRYFMAILSEAMQDGLVKGYLDGDGKTGPIGIFRQIGTVESAGTNKAKTVLTTVKKFSPKGLAPIRKTLTNDGKRTVDKLYLICNPSDEAEYVDPCMYGEALTGGYVNKSFIDIEKIVDANCPKGKAAFTIAGYYTMGTAGVRVDEYDQTKAIEDADLIVAKCYANGRAVDDNVAVVFDVTKLEEYVLPVNQVTVPKQA